MDLFKLLRSENILRHGASKGNINRLRDYLKDEIINRGFIYKDDDVILSDVKIFLCNLLKRWKNCKSKENSFIAKQRNWLEQSFDVSKYTESCPGSSTVLHIPKTGRPPKPFFESTSRAKRRRIQPLLEKHSPEELAYATQKSH